MLTNHAADIQDRDGAPPLMRASRRRWPFVELAFMDAGYAGDRVASATPIRVEIVRKPKQQVGFAVHARRWVIERFFAWIGRNRRLAKDFEASIASANTFLYAASVTILLHASLVAYETLTRPPLTAESRYVSAFQPRRH